MPVVVSPRRRIASRGTLRAMQLQAVQCSSPSGPRDAALQSSLNAGQESSNRQRSGLFTRTQVAYALVAAKCTVLASVLQDASKRRRAKPIFALGISIGARRRCHRSPLHPHQPLRHHHSPRSLSNLKHSPESILARGTLDAIDIARSQNAALRRNLTKQRRRRRRLDREREWSGRRIHLPRDDARQHDGRTIIFLRRGHRELRRRRRALCDEGRHRGATTW